MPPPNALLHTAPGIAPIFPAMVLLYGKSTLKASRINSVALLFLGG